jgi:S-adenosylmethionine/arginine decarboxylase-like enzyme
MKTLKQNIKQRIVATVVVMFMFSMLFGSLNLPGVSATGTNTNLIQNFIPGGFAHQAQQNLVFTQITVGAASNTTANMLQTNVWDFRGSGAGWSISGVCNDMLTTQTGVNMINATQIRWNPAGATVTAFSGVTTGITNGTLQTLETSKTLISAAVNSGMGNYRMWNVLLNIQYNGRTDQKTGTYGGILTMTSS